MSQKTSGTNFLSNFIGPSSNWERRLVKKSATCENCGVKGWPGDIVSKHKLSHKTYRCLVCDVKCKRGHLSPTPSYTYGSGQLSKAHHSFLFPTFQKVTYKALEEPQSNNSYEWIDLGPCPESEMQPCFGTPHYEERIAPILEKYKDWLNMHFPLKYNMMYELHDTKKFGGTERTIRLYYSRDNAKYAEHIKNSIPSLYSNYDNKIPPNNQIDTSCEM